jgi:alkanesulfonate monooxygenase SsuD/methylene tetrahydromethanopterin reductase-like flavin-dependent oxidoreductase (luciferase family)
MLEPQEGLLPEDVIRAARLSEKLGFGYILRSDHLLPTSGRRGISSPECWTTLGAIAASTNKIKFGPLVSPVGFRNPALLARMATTVNSLSKGRLQLGLGAGWYEDEYKAFGIPFPDFKERRNQFLEALRIIRVLVDEGKVNFDGRYFSAHMETRLDIKGIKIVVGGKAPSIIRAASKYADEWNVFAPTKDEFARLRQNLTSQVQVSQMGPFFIADNHDTLKQKIVGRMKSVGVSVTYDDYLKRLRSRNVIMGTTREFSDQLKERVGWGISKFYFQTLEPNDEESIGLLADTLKSIS